MSDETSNDVRTIAGNIVSAYLSNNQLTAADVPAFIRSVIAALGEEAASESPPEQQQQPAVPIKKSVRSDAVVCLECGATQKTLKRHLGVAHNLTPAEYREKWNLPKDYPMVAPSYAEARSAMAKKIGLGRQGKGGRAISK